MTKSLLGLTVEEAEMRFPRDASPEERAAIRASYEPLPRPVVSRVPETTKAAFNWGAACGALGLGIPDFASVTAAVGRSGKLSDYDVAAIKGGRFRACCAGHKLGRERAGLPALAAWQREEEEGLARRAS